ncbi:unnamed protein product [Prunus armeniaca]
MKCVRVVPLESIAEIPFQKKQQAEPQSHSSWYTQMSVDQCRLLPKLEVGPVWHCCAVKIIAVRFAVREISCEIKQFGVW